MEYDLLEHTETTLPVDGSRTKEQQAVLVNEALYRRYKGGQRSTWAKQAKEDLAFVNGAMWKEEDATELEAKGQPAIVINEIKPGIEQLVAQLTANKPRFNSTGRENSDAETAQNYADLGAWIWDISKGNQKLKRAVRDYEHCGIGALMVYVDPYADFGKGEIFITDVDPFTLYIDPNAKEPDTSDAQHKLIAKVLTSEQIQAIYPGIDLKDAMPSRELDDPSTDRHLGEDQILSVNDITHNKYLIIDRYSKIKVKHYDVFDPNSNFERILDESEYQKYVQRPAVVLQAKDRDPKFITDENEVQYYLEVLKSYGETIHYNLDQNGQPVLAQGVEDANSIPNSTTLIKVSTIEELIKSGAIMVNEPLLPRIQRVLTIGGKFVFDKIYPVENHLIVTFMLHHNRNPYPMGDVRLVKPLNEELNKIESLIISHASNSTNVKVIIGKDTVDKKKFMEEFSRAGAAILEVDLELGSPIIVQPVPLPNELYKNRDDKSQQIQRILGAFAFQDGDVTQAPQTYGGTLTIDEMGQRRSRSKREDIEEAINTLFKTVAELIPHVYTERKVVRLLSPNHEVKETIFNNTQKGNNGLSEIINDVTVGRYDIVVVSGSMLPSNRYARSQMMVEYYKLGILKNPAPILRESDIPNISKVLEDEDVINQLQGALSQAQKRIEELEGDLQTANRETVQANQKVEVMKFRSDVIGPAKNKIEAATALTQARLNDHVKNTKQSNNRG